MVCETKENLQLHPKHVICTGCDVQLVLTGLSSVIIELLNLKSVSLLCYIFMTQLNFESTYFQNWKLL